MTADPWTTLAQTHGRKSVMSLAIDDATLDAETERQAAEIFPLIRRYLRGDERTALDYGCGYGRFTPYLAGLVSGTAYGFDPCGQMLPGHAPPRIQFVTGDADRFFDAGFWNRPVFDLIFAAMVLGDPNMDLPGTVSGLASVLDPNGLMVVLDHTPETPAPGRWWRFRPERAYIEAFANHGIVLSKIGGVMQLSEPVTILAGRHP